MTASTPIDLRSRPTLILLVCLLLPLIGLGYSWGQTYRAAQRGTVWEIPVDGYDPRDLLRGHYVQFRYRWPGSTSEPGGFLDYTASSLCLTGNAPTPASVEEIGAARGACPIGHFVSGSARSAQGFDRGRLYVPQTRGPEYEKKLADPKIAAFIRVRVDDNGALRPMELVFRARKPGDPSEQQPRQMDILVPPPVQTSQP